MAGRRPLLAGIAAGLLAASALGAIVVRLQRDDGAAQVVPENARAADESRDRFLGCVRQIGRDSFSLAVSRVLPDDPLRIETYGLDGGGGLVLAEHVDHTIEVVGTLADTSADAFPRLHVASARHVAAFCWRP